MGKEAYLRETLLNEIEYLSKLKGFWSDDALLENNWKITYHGFCELELLVVPPICYLTLYKRFNVPLDLCRDLKHYILEDKLTEFIPELFDYSRMHCFSNIETDDWYCRPSSFELKIRIYNE